MANTCQVTHNHYYCSNSDDSTQAGSGVKQILSGTGQLQGQGPSAVGFAAPGGSQTLPPDFPLPGQGETASQIILPAGTIRNLRVVAVPHAATTTGNVDFVVRVNGADTPVSCQVSGSGTADSGTATVLIADGDLVTVRVENTLLGNMKVNFTYAFEFLA